MMKLVLLFVAALALSTAVEARRRKFYGGGDPVLDKELSKMQKEMRKEMKEYMPEDTDGDPGTSPQQPAQRRRPAKPFSSHPHPRVGGFREALAGRRCQPGAHGRGDLEAGNIKMEKGGGVGRWGLRPLWPRIFGA